MMKSCFGCLGAEGQEVKINGGWEWFRTRMKTMGVMAKEQWLRGRGRAVQE